MNFKTQETSEENNVIKSYKRAKKNKKNPDNFGLNCSGYLISPLSSPLCPPPADLLTPARQLGRIICVGLLLESGQSGVHMQGGIC